MDYGDHQCVGCDAHTFGIYRANPNWHLCWSCYEMWQDNQEEFEADYRSPGWDRYKKNKILRWKK